MNDSSPLPFTDLRRGEDAAQVAAAIARVIEAGWFVLGPEKQIEVHRQPKDGRYSETTLHGPRGKLTSIALPECALSLDELFAK